MKYEIGEKIKITRYDYLVPDVKKALDKLLPEQIATIKAKTNSFPYHYWMEEIGWPWSENEIEKYIPSSNNIPINDRFEILDLRR